MGRNQRHTNVESKNLEPNKKNLMPRKKLKISQISKSSQPVFNKLPVKTMMESKFLWTSSSSHPLWQNLVHFSSSLLQKQVNTSACSTEKVPSLNRKAHTKSNRAKENQFHSKIPSSRRSISSFA